MADVEYICPYCKHEFYADENEVPICPSYGKEVKKDPTEELLI
jgi:hypothetical protein